MGPARKEAGEPEPSGRRGGRGASAAPLSAVLWPTARARRGTGQRSSCGGCSQPAPGLKSEAGMGLSALPRRDPHRAPATPRREGPRARLDLASPPKKQRGRARTTTSRARRTGARPRPAIGCPEGRTEAWSPTRPPPRPAYSSGERRLCSGPPITARGRASNHSQFWVRGGDARARQEPPETRADGAEKPGTGLA